MRWKIKNGYVSKKADVCRIIWLIVRAASENMRNMGPTVREEVEIQMGQTCILTGMILNTMPVGEYDKRITILTRERGKVTAFARGARRPRSSLQAATNLFCFGRFEAYEGRSSYTVVKAEISNYFRELATDLDLTYYGCYFLEVADYFSQENNDEQEILKLLYQTLKALENPSLPNRLIRCIYELKMLVINGIYPNVFSCQLCGKRENLVDFSVERAGMLCMKCAGRERGIRLEDSVLYAMQFIISSELRSLYTFTVSEAVLKQLEQILFGYLQKYVAHTFKSEQFLCL